MFESFFDDWREKEKGTERDMKVRWRRKEREREKRNDEEEEINKIAASFFLCLFLAYFGGGEL